MSEREFIGFSRASIGEAEMSAVREVLESGWITTGPKAREFERAFAEYSGHRHAVAVNSCTAGMHIALDAKGIEAGDIVLVPSQTFAATGEVVAYLGATPVLMEIDAESMNMDCEAAAALCRAWRQEGLSGAEKLAADGVIAAGTLKGLRVAGEGSDIRAAIPVHFAGLPCETSPLRGLEDLFVLEDAAHAIESSVPGGGVANDGGTAAFSFYATKNITCAEGGMVVTDDDELEHAMRVLSLHGISRDAWNRYSDEGSWYYEIERWGYKYNLTDVAAAMGLVQLSRIEVLREQRMRWVELYSELLSEVDDVILPPRAKDGRVHSWHLYVLRLNERARASRADLVERLHARGVGTSVHFIPLHRHPLYSEMFGLEPGDFPMTDGVYESCLSLPLYPGLTEEQVRYVASCVVESLGQSTP